MAKESTMRLAATLLGIAIWLSGDMTARAQQPADHVWLGGDLLTLAEQTPTAQAIAVRGDRIVAVGSDEQVRKFIGDATHVESLDNRFVMPGFIEGHAHFVSLGQAKMMLDLTRAKKWEDIVNQVAARAKELPEGTWIVGRGWHQSKWDQPPPGHIEGYPTHHQLSRLSPRHPVLLTHASGHMLFANAAAMRLAGVSQATADPTGGEILRDADGHPSGVFRETAGGLIQRARGRALRGRSAAERKRERLQAIELATQDCLSKGVTTLHDAGSAFATIDLLRELADERKLRLRLWVMVRDSNDRLRRQLADYRTVGAGNNFLTVRAIKRSIDGALGPHGAWLLEPYEDLPSSSGLNTSSIESIRETAQLAARHDYQLCVHAIGDRANRETLDIFAAAFAQDRPGTDRRWRVEHAQHLHPTDIRRFGELNVIASMQGVHCTSDAVFVVQRLGQRRAASGAYAWRSLIDQGAIVINGTDAPVEDVDPLASLYATVSRKLASGVVFFPQQRMTRLEALRSYTINAAYAGFEEQLKGTLEAGKLADFVILSNNLATCTDEEILQTKVLATVVGGKVVYRGPQS